jgi:uncharacterized protein YndB with AHSA1/START domain
MPREEKNNPPPKVVVRKTIAATRDAIFDAWTKPELMQRWFFPLNWSAKSSNDLRVGGSYRHEMISDGARSDCAGDAPTGTTANHLHSGEYLEIRRPDRLVFTWNSHAVKNTRVTVELRDVGGATEVIVTHELLETEELRARHMGGWENCLENLATFLS